jgi:hypothetical protein
VKRPLPLFLIRPHPLKKEEASIHFSFQDEEALTSLFKKRTPYPLKRRVASLTSLFKMKRPSPVFKKRTPSTFKRDVSLLFQGDGVLFKRGEGPFILKGRDASAPLKKR